MFSFAASELIDCVVTAEDDEVLSVLVVVLGPVVLVVITAGALDEVVGAIY